MTRIKRVAFTVYPVQDLAKARAFYEQVLGLEPGENFHGEFQEYDLDGTTFAIDANPVEAAGSQGSLALEVADLHDFAQELRDQGVRFDKGTETEVMETPVCYMAFIRDPDGNLLALHQAKTTA